MKIEKKLQIATPPWIWSNIYRISETGARNDERYKYHCETVCT